MSKQNLGFIFCFISFELSKNQKEKLKSNHLKPVILSIGDIGAYQQVPYKLK